MFIKIIFIIFALIAIAKTTKRFKNKEISGREFSLWLILWLAIGLVVLSPQTTDALAQSVGVYRGADLLVYCSVLVLFYINFRLLVKVDKLEREITVLVRKIAQRNSNQDSQD